MKLPMSAPDWNGLFDELIKRAPSEFTRILTTSVSDDSYLHWDKLRHKKPPEGWTHDEWWLALKHKRLQQRRQVALRDKNGSQFSYVLTDKILKSCDEIAGRASGQVGTAEQVLDAQGRNQYIVKSLVEEAITSSQLEGASTSRRVAKEMIESGREPRDKSEIMIYNNYVAMQRIRDISSEKLTPDTILDLHRLLVEDTLDDPNDAGRLETPDHDRVRIWDQDILVHTPPPAEELPERLQQLCDFANGDGADYLPPVVRAIIVHFMVGFDHYFVDGNGRTARALFYWTMLNQGYWLSEYVTISKVLKNAPSKYSTAYLLTEDDEGDLTYFIHYQLDVFLRGLDDLDRYLEAKGQELRTVREALQAGQDGLNHRQVSVLEWLSRDQGHTLDVSGYAKRYAVGDQTARNDLNSLTELGYLVRFKIQRAYAWRVSPSLAAQLVD